MAQTCLRNATRTIGLIVAVSASADRAQASEARSAPRPAVAMRVTAPSGFERLTEPQQVLLDVIMNGQRVGEAMAVVENGRFRFVDAARLVASLPQIADRERVQAALAVSDLDPHRDAVCPPGALTACARPRPDVAGIVYDAARYRVEIVVNPRYLTVRAAVQMQNLPPPSREPALVNFLSGTVSGGGSLPVQYAIQDNAVLSIGAGRIRANVQQASHSGLQTDTLAGEIDRPGLRYRAGSFWVPGNTLVDRIKILGVGLSTQFDTRLDRDQIMGSPLILFLDQRARVDILVNGSIMSSLAYDPGNQALDTARLPEGSYTVILRITSADGSVREESRFFSRSAILPMTGHDAFFVYAGAFVRNSEGLIGDVTRTPLFQAAWARRLRPSLSINFGLIGSDRRQWVSAGATVLTASWQLDTSVHVGSHAGLGVYGHVTRTNGGRLSIDLDARHVSNPGGGPLLEATTFVLPVAGGLEYTRDQGAYTQLSGAVGYQLGQSRLTLAGTYRRQQGRRRDYSLGPALYMPLLRRGALTLDFNGTYAFTSLGRQAYVGLNLGIMRPRTTYTAVGGAQSGPGGRGLGDGAYGGFNVSRRFDDVLDAQVQVDGGVQHAGGISYADATLQARSRKGDANLDVVQPFGEGGLQYGASVHTAMVVGHDGLRFGEAGNGDAMIVVGVYSQQRDTGFEVLVDNRVAGSVVGGQELTLSLPSYRAYAVRIRGSGGAMSAYDAEARQVSLYPGSVARLKWQARPVVAVFGRLVRADGTALAHAEITAGSDLAQSDERGHFLIQTGNGATLTARTRDGRSCIVTLDTVAPAEGPTEGYAKVGDQVCRTVTTPFAATPAMSQPSS